MHDAVACGDHVHVGEGLLGPLDEVEAVLVAALFDVAVFLKGIRIEAAALHGQRVVHDQLHRHHGVHLGGVAAFLGDGVTQAGQVHQRGLAQDVVAGHARREPWEVTVTLALDQLRQALGHDGWVGLAHDVLGVHARGVGQGGPGAGLDRVDGFAGIVVVELRAGQGLAVGGGHGGGRRAEAVGPVHRHEGMTSGHGPEMQGGACGATVSVKSLAILDRHELLVFRAGVVGRRADDLAVDALLDHVGGPATGAGDHEQRREHRSGHAHHVVADG